MAAVVTPGQVPGSDSYRAKRTEALPKTSLFGSPLEIQNKENATGDIDPSAVHFPSAPHVRGPGQRFTLPDDVKNKLPAAGIFERSKRDYDVQKNLVNQQANDLKQKEEKVLFDRSAVNAEPLSHREPGTARGFKFTEGDLIGSKEINKLGLNVNQSYNRDKYGQKAPVHNYSLIGDVLRPGMDFPRRERTDVQMRNMGYGKGDLRGILAETPRRTRQNGSSSAKPLLTEKSIEVPPNIKHQFGTKECDRLLSDTEAVNKTVRQQKELKDSLQRKSQPFEVPKFSREVNPEYEMLGNALRMNVVPGYTTDHKISTTKTAFNDQVHLFRYQDPDKWRYQKDELSKWAEHNVLRQRMTKAWEQYFIETLSKKNQAQS